MENSKLSNSKSASRQRAVSNFSPRSPRPGSARQTTEKAKSPSKMRNYAASPKCETCGMSRSVYSQRNNSMLLGREKSACERGTLHDREELFHELTLAKQDTNLFREENLRLKTKLQLCEQDASKKDKLVRELLEKIEAIEAVADPPRSSRLRCGTRMEAELKKQIKELKQEKERVEEEYSSFRREVKVTRLQELAAEVKAYADECQRLRKIVDTYSEKSPGLEPEEVQEIEEKIDRQSAIITNLKQDNAALSKTIQQKDIETNELKEIIEMLKKKNTKLGTHRKQNVKQKKVIAESNKKIKTLKEQLSFLKIDSKDNEFIAYKSRIEELLRGQMELRAQLEQKERKIRTMETRRETSKQNSMLSMSENECKRLSGKISDYEQQIELLSSQKSSSRQKVKPVSSDQIKWIVVELRLSLILAKIQFNDIKSKVFGDSDLDEPFSIYEVVRSLRRKPLRYYSNDAVLLARYLVEDKGNEEVEYDEHAEAPFRDIMNPLKALIGEYKVLNEEEKKKVIEEIEKKVERSAEKVAEELKSLGTETVSREYVEQTLANHGVTLSIEECDYLTLQLFEQTGDINRLKCQSILGMLERPIEANMRNEKEKEREREKEREQEEEKGNIRRETEIKKDELVVERASSGKKEEEKTGESGTEYQSIDEEQMVVVAQKCFAQIAQKLIEKNMTIHSLYKDKIIKKTVDGEEIELLTQLDFVNGMQELDMEDMEPLQYVCIIQVLAINDEEKHIRVNDLTQILEDYGVSEPKATAPTDKPKEPLGVPLEAPVDVPVEQPAKEAERTEEKKSDMKDEAAATEQKEEEQVDMDFELLDKVSMVLMLALTEYMAKSHASLQELFGESIYAQTVTSGSEKSEVELLDSAEFFAVLSKIGINIEEKEHQNLKKFLCHDPLVPEKFSVEKLAIAIEEFGSNEDLREYAHKCYEELANENYVENYEDEEGENKANNELEECLKDTEEEKAEQEGVPDFGDDSAPEGNNTL